MLDTEIVSADPPIRLRISGRFNYIPGWPESREDLGLNRAGDAAKGVSIVNEEKGDDGNVVAVVLEFAEIRAVENASNRLHEKATERFEWGDAGGGEKVQSFAGALPSSYRLEEL